MKMERDRFTTEKIMKKALTLLAVAAMAAVSFVGCSKTYDVDATLETGTANYDFKGKTFVKISLNRLIRRLPRPLRTLPTRPPLQPRL